MKASDITHNEPLLNVKGIIRFFIISFIVLNIFNLKYCFSFYVNSVTLLLLFFLIFGILFFVFAIFEVYIKGKLRISSYIGVLSVVCLLTVFSGMFISGIQADLSKQKAETIIEALYNYKTANDHYPDSLKYLVPEYLESIPISSMGWFDEPYKYFKSKDEEFRILFPYYGGDPFYWDSNFGKWMLLD